VHFAATYPEVYRVAFGEGSPKRGGR